MQLCSAAVLYLINLLQLCSAAVLYLINLLQLCSAAVLYLINLLQLCSAAVLYLINLLQLSSAAVLYLIFVVKKGNRNVKLPIFCINFFDLQVWFHLGMSTSDEDYELCTRVDNVNLPKFGYFGVSAATGGLAGKFELTSLAHKFKLLYLNM